MEATRDEMYTMMDAPAPETRSQRALRKIAHNQRRLAEQVLLRKVRAVLRGEMHPDEEEDAWQRSRLVEALKLHLCDLKKKERKNLSFGRVLNVTAESFDEEVSNAGEKNIYIMTIMIIK